MPFDGRQQARNVALRSVWYLQRVSSLAKLLILGVVYVAAAVCLTRVTTTAGPPLPALDAAYEALRLFLVDPSGRPIDGPAPFVWGLWLAMFGAPMVAGGFLLDRVAAVTWRVIGSPPELLRFHGHAVICGYGTHGQGIARWLAAHRLAVVVVDENRSKHSQWIRLRHDSRDVAPLIAGDMQDPDVLHLASAERASVVVFATRDCMANLRAASALQHLQHGAASATRDAVLLALVDEPESLGELVRSLNAQHPEAARIVLVSRFAVAEDLAEDFVATVHACDRAVVVGLGRFGGALARRLQSSVAHLVVVDRELERCLARVNLGGPVQQVSADALAWARSDAPEGLAGAAAVFLCLDDDLANLRVATALSRHHARDMRVVLRAAHPVFEGVDTARSPSLQVQHTTALVERWFDKHGPDLLRPPGARAR